MKVSRTSRLNGEYQKEISALLRPLKDREPELKGMISVTEVDVAPDLKTAYVYVSIYGVDEEQSKKSFALLGQSAGYLRHELAQVMRMRTVPALTFRWDKSMVYGSKMDELLKGLTYTTNAEDDEK